MDSVSTGSRPPRGTNTCRADLFESLLVNGSRGPVARKVGRPSGEARAIVDRRSARKAIAVADVVFVVLASCSATLLAWSVERAAVNATECGRVWCLAVAMTVYLVVALLGTLLMGSTPHGFAVLKRGGRLRGAGWSRNRPVRPGGKRVPA